MQFDFKEKAKKRQDRNSPIKPFFCIQFENPSKVSWGEFQISMGFVQPPRSAPIFASPHESLVTRNICDQRYVAPHLRGFLFAFQGGASVRSDNHWYHSIDKRCPIQYGGLRCFCDSCSNPNCHWKNIRSLWCF